MNVMTPYKGKGKFIFINYAPEDKERVFAVLERLIAAGCWIWCNKGTDPETEWDEKLGDLGERFDGFIAFVSHNYMASETCKSDLIHASSFGKDGLIVYLEDVALPSEMQMRLKHMQAIHNDTFECESGCCEKMTDISMMMRDQEIPAEKQAGRNSDDRMIKEALRRMKMLKLWAATETPVMKSFEERQELFVSDQGGLPGRRMEGIYPLSTAEKKLVKEFEQKNGYLVYHVIRTEELLIPVGINVQYSFLYVSDRPNEWEDDKNDILGIMSFAPLHPNAYVYSAGNVPWDAQDLSEGHGEFMRIGICFRGGRVWRVS